MILINTTSKLEELKTLISSINEDWDDYKGIDIQNTRNKEKK
jgi:hypothetical protein